MTDDHQKRQILMANLERAIEIAVLAHKGASDKSGAPYILHPLRLMFGIEDIEAKIVAVLHDVVEDSKPPYRWGLQELETEGFSANVIEALDCVTKRPDEPYEAFIERILPRTRFDWRLQHRRDCDGVRPACAPTWVVKRSSSTEDLFSPHDERRLIPSAGIS
jgi:hypothetical protein